MVLDSNLSRAEIRAVSLVLRTAGLRLPKIGWSVEIPSEARATLRLVRGSVFPPRSISHDANGYFYSY